MLSIVIPHIDEDEGGQHGLCFPVHPYLLPFPIGLAPDLKNTQNDGRRQRVKLLEFEVLRERLYEASLERYSGPCTRSRLLQSASSLPGISLLAGIWLRDCMNLPYLRGTTVS